MKKIIIVGGGLSGLSLAFLLEKKGLAPTIIEASSRLGGRIQTIPGPLGTPLELGATWFSDMHQELLKLLTELELAKYPQFTKGDALFQTKSFEPPQLFSIPEAEQPSYRIAGGTYSLIEALHSRLERTEIQLNIQITEVKIGEGDTLILESNEHAFSCDKVVFCMPPQLMSGIRLPEGLPQDLLALLPTVQTWMAGAIKFVLEYDKPFWRQRNLSGMLYSHADIVTEMYDHTNISEDRFGFTGFLNGGAAAYPQSVRKSNVLRHLSGLLGDEAQHPTFYDDKVWNDEFIIQGGQPVERPHQNNGHLLLQHGYLGNRLYFCGTETSPVFGGYMEGAIQATMRAATLLT
jgi:monoamine oxidase